MLEYLYGKRFGSKIAWANRPTFSNLVILHIYPPIKMEQTECSETSAYKIHTPAITQKKAYNIQNTAKVWNQECFKFITSKGFSDCKHITDRQTYVYSLECCVCIHMCEDLYKEDMRRDAISIPSSKVM